MHALEQVDLHYRFRFIVLKGFVHTINFCCRNCIVQLENVQHYFEIARTYSESMNGDVSSG